MRISDWSSDVCSSDLGIDTLQERAVRRRIRSLAMRLAFGSIRTSTRPFRLSSPKQIGRASCRESVSVRVDLGGRRIIKKKNLKRSRIKPSTTKTLRSNQNRALNHIIQLSNHI